MNRLGNKHEHQENPPLFSTEHFGFENLYTDKSLITDQDSVPTTPERPNMGSRSAMERARADRNDRYLALLNQDPETASDTETDPDLNLVPSPARTFRHSSHKSTTIGLDNSAHESDPPTDKFRFAVEAIERTSGTVYDQSTSSSTENLDQVSKFFRGDFPYMIEAIERTSGTMYDQSAPSSTENSNKVSTLVRGDLPYMIEAIERTSGTMYDQSASSSTENSNKVSTILRGDFPYMVEAIERTPLPSSPVQKNPSLELKDIGRMRASLPDLLVVPSSGNASADRIPRETPDDTGGTSLAHLVNVIRESKRSSESTVAAESDCFLGTGEDRMQNKVDKITTPIPKENGTIANQAKPLGRPSPSSSNYSSSTNESCALTTHDPLCYARIPWPTVHCRTSPSPDGAGSKHTGQNPSNDDGNGDEKGTRLESQIDEYKRSPWSDLLFDKDVKDITEPSPPENTEPPPPEDTGLSEITLHASTFLRLRSSELQLRPRKDHDSEIRHAVSQRGHNESVNNDLDEVAFQKFEHSPKSMERSFNAARLPDFGETLPPLTYSPPRGRKVPNKAKRPVRYKQMPADTSGSAKKTYTYSQIVNGDKKVDQLRRSLEMISSQEDDVPSGKGVSWAKEDELIGYADPQTPISKRIPSGSLDNNLAEGHDVNFRVDTSDKENASFEWKPSVEQDFRVSHFMVVNASIDSVDTPDHNFSEMWDEHSQLSKFDKSEQGFRVFHYKTGTDIPDDSLLEMWDKQSQLSKFDESKRPEMTPSARKILQNLFNVDGADTEKEGATSDVRVVSPWSCSEKKSVAKHLMSVVYDLEEMGINAGLKEDGDESEEKGDEE